MRLAITMIPKRSAKRCANDSKRFADNKSRPQAAFDFIYLSKTY
jgi:hypothetical protein